MVASLNLARESIHWSIFMRSSWIGSCVSSRVGSSFRPRRRRAVMRKGKVEVKPEEAMTMKTAKEIQSRRMRGRRSGKRRKKINERRKKRKEVRGWGAKTASQIQCGCESGNRNRRSRRWGAGTPKGAHLLQIILAPLYHARTTTGPSDGVHGSCQRRDTFGGRRD
jgi:hypothetical protein